MTYIDYLNEFNQWLESNILPGNAQLLYFRLLNIFNRAGWPEQVQVDTLRLMLMTDCKKDAAYHARDKLRDAGFISYRKGKKGSPTIYFLSDRTTENATECTTKIETETATENATHIKTKTKTISPHTPQSGGHGPEDVTDDDFAQFWSAYPRKVGKQAARKAFKKVKVPVGMLLDAVERQKQTRQWQKDNGQYIPHPATWLNQGRWEDEDETAKELPPVSKRGRLAVNENGEEVVVFE